MSNIEQNKELVRGYVQAILIERDFSKFSQGRRCFARPQRRLRKWPGVYRARP